MSTLSFQTTVRAGQQKNVTGLEIPREVIASLGAGQRPRLKITVNGYSFVSTVGKMGGRYMISLSAAHRVASGLSGGDPVEVVVQLAAEPVQIAVPADLAAALASAQLADAFARAAPSRRKEWVRSIEDAKAAETRSRRVGKVIDALTPSS